MAEPTAGAGSWMVTEDGCLNVDDDIESMLYHPSLNVVMVTSKSAVVRVIDVSSGEIFHISNLSDDANNIVRCTYLPSQDRVVFVSKNAVGARRDLNGVILLDSALQAPVTKPDDLVRIELPLPDAIHLYRCLMTVELPGVDFVVDVLQELNKQIEQVQQASRHSHKVAKWATVCLKMPHNVLKSVFSGLLAELKRSQQKVAALPIAAAVHDRLTYLLLNGSNQVDLSASSGGIIDRALMYSELTRRETFAKWPHANYKWALPEPMAQAGFYYQPSSSGDDRAMCFTCNVCLVCWEPTDEPWSEHERHSPQCPFVKGEFTQNVPLSVTYATEPAQLHGLSKDNIECISTTTSSHFVATSTLHGNVVVWNVDTQLQKHVSLNVDLTDSVTVSQLCLAVSDNQLITRDVIRTASCEQLSSATTNTEVDGNTEQTNVDKLPASIGAEVYVTALSVLADPTTSATTTATSTAAAAAAAVNVAGSSAPVSDVASGSLSCLVVGATLFADFIVDNTASAVSSNGAENSSAESLGIDTVPADTVPMDTVLSTADTVPTDAMPTGTTAGADWCSNVQVLNRLNEALSSSDCAVKRCCVPCLLLYNIPDEQNSLTPSTTLTDCKHKSGVGVVGPSSGGISISLVASGSTAGSSNIATGSEMYGVKDLDNSDDDFDVQIIGVTPAMTPPKVVTYNGTVDGGPVGSSYKSFPAGKEFELEMLASSKVLQCLQLPCTDQYITSILSIVDGQRVLVTTAPVQADVRLLNALQRHAASSQSDSVAAAAGGCMFVYGVNTASGTTLLTESPLLSRVFTQLNDSVMSTSVVPVDFGQSEDLELSCVEPLNAIVATTLRGDIEIISLTDLSVLNVISGDVFTSAIYCTGVDRLCASTTDSRLKFFSVTRPEGQLVAGHDDVDGVVTLNGTTTGTSLETTQPTHKTELYIPTCLLVDRPLTVDVLAVLHDLTLFETLQPRFSAMVPPCWTEIQQEQQQRKHPQHLHQKHGDASQHTRTWRLQSDSTSWEEHLFELVLPKPCSIGHIDVKFCLNSLCTSPPNIQVTLLKQNISSIRPTVSTEDATIGSAAAADTQSSINSQLAGAEVICGPLDLSKYVDLSGTQGIVPLTGIKLLKVKSKSFLLHLKAKTSKQDKQTQGTEKQKPPSGTSTTASTTTSTTATSAPSKTTRSDSPRGCDWLQEISVTVRKFQQIRIPAERAERFAMLESENFHRQLMSIVCCCDDLLMTGSSCREYRQQQALDILCWIMAIQMNDSCYSVGEESNLAGTSATIDAAATSATTDAAGSTANINVLSAIQCSLSSLVHSGLVEADRTVAHKTAKLLALCLEYVKNSMDCDIAVTFNYALLQSLLDSLPLTLNSMSAGALHWYFTLLNHVKCLDANATAQRCTQLLAAVARQYHSLGGANSQHALLRARYGLYGCPLDVDLFDVEPPPLRTVPATTAVPTGASYASIVASSMGPVGAGVSGLAGIAAGLGGVPVPSTTTSTSTAASAAYDDVVFKDLMSLCSTDNNGNTGSPGKTDVPMTHYLNGLLEVEPLHFTCHATSDGTRMERMDTTGQLSSLPSGVASGLSGTINFSESLTSGVGALSSLSTAMASAEQQLQHLQQKQLQLLKLQQQKQKLEQKLAETSKSQHMTSSSNLLHYTPYSSELFPPTPKNTPFFMTPPVTPPNESYHVFVGGAPADGVSIVTDKPPIGPAAAKLANKDKSSGAAAAASVSGAASLLQQPKPVLVWPQTHNLFQSPPAQALVIERMHSGARRFVVLDFGKPILLTDVVIPMCGDLASLSIDIWTDSEETDGHRLVVSTDIGISSLIMNDIMPAPVCRYLKITTIRRYGGNTTRSRIPIGSFYGHTFILPWQREAGSLQSASHCLDASYNVDQSVVLSQLNIYTALLEEVQCRYSLAAKNLVNLLSAVDVNNIGLSHYSQYFLKKGKRTDEDNHIFQAYYDCCQLQVQLNLARHAIVRLQRLLGINTLAATSPSVAPVTGSVDIDGPATTNVLRRASVDKLRVLTEFLLDTLLSMTNSSSTIPDVPASLYNMFTPQFGAMLFRSLCVHGTRKTQTHAGVLLVRVCATQPWWGQFLGDMLQEFFAADQATNIFPQDRVFILLAALGQRSLTSVAAASILDNILCLLARLLSPLKHRDTNTQPPNIGQLDLSLIGWVLLFVSKCLDSVRLSDDLDRVGRDREGGSRWNFIAGESGLQANKLSSRHSASSKLYRRKLQKRLMHHKQQLLDLQQAKKHFMSTQLEKAADSSAPLDKTMEHLLKTQEMLFKRQFKQYSSKHLKDIINLRRTDGELLRRLNKSECGGVRTGTAAGAGSSDAAWDELDNTLTVSTESCLPVVHGLVTLLLSMDFTCHVDLFIIACKVLARLTTITRPAVSLSEAMSREQLEQLLMLTCNVDYNHGNVSWGGAWAGHSITCLLQDILDGERLCTSNMAAEFASTDSDMLLNGGAAAAAEDTTTAAAAAAAAAAVSIVTDLDESLQNSCTLPPVDDEIQSNDATAPDTPNSKLMLEASGGASKYDCDDMSLLVDALMDDDLSDSEGGGAPSKFYSNDTSSAAAAGAGVKAGWLPPKLMNVTMKSVSNSNTIHWGPTISNVFGLDDKENVYKAWKGKLGNLATSKPPAAVSNTTVHGVSLAMDSRLENGIELCAELRLKVMLSVEANNVHNALMAPLPPPPPPPVNTSAATAGSQPTDDSELSDDTVPCPVLSTLSSIEMLSCCFSNLFSKLPQGRINLEVLLQTWLMLNDDTSTGLVDCAAALSVDTSRCPLVPLDRSAVTGLLAAVANLPIVQPRLWVLVLQTLSLLAASPPNNHTVTADSSIAMAIVADSNTMVVLNKFLSEAPVVSAGHKLHIGPAVVQAFHELLMRLELRCSGSVDSQLNSLLLNLVNSLTAEGGALQLCSGPLDAQCRLLEDIVESGIEFSLATDVSVILTIIESASVLIHRHILSQEHISCRSSLESSISARSCFGGLFAGVLRGNDTARRSAMNGEADRDQLICGLLRLVCLLVQRRLPSTSPWLTGGRRAEHSMAAAEPAFGTSETTVGLSTGGGAGVNGVSGVVESPQTELSHVSQSLGASGAVMTSTPNIPTDSTQPGSLPAAPGSQPAGSAAPTGSVTDEQKTETTRMAAGGSVGSVSVTLAPTAAPVLSMRWTQKPCSHDTSRPPTVADIVAGSRQIMAYIIEALSCCNSSTIAMILASSGLPAASDSFTTVDRSNLVSVGDGIFQLLSVLNSSVSDVELIVKPLYQYLTGQLHTSVIAARICRLSEPLIWFILRVLDCVPAVRSFLNMGGVEVIARNLVDTNRHVINTSPSLVSSIMQYFGSSRPVGGNGRRSTSYQSDPSSDSSLQNFALLGTISSSSPSASPPDVLIQGTPPHRRARTAAWSYHFYPDEAWVDLTVSLPCAVLLKEVIIQPHLTSLATCPAAVTVEGSRDGGITGMVPLCAPVATSGLTTIKVQLVRHEIVSSVTIRLHKPRDSQTIGLSQIMLMGYMAFGDTTGSSAARLANVFTPMEDYVSRTSIGWLRLLHHCLTQCDTMRVEVTQAAAPTSDLLLTCTTLLMSSSALVYASSIESVLLILGLHSVEMGLLLIDHILRRTSFSSDDGRLMSPHGKIHGKANESTVEILYRLGTHNDAGLLTRMRALMDWLGDSARVAIQKAYHSMDGTDRFHTVAPHIVSTVGLPTPAVAHVHLVAAILWHNHEHVPEVNIKQIITRDLLSCLYEWSLVLNTDSPLKHAVDCVLCSLCYIDAGCFSMLLEWMGLIRNIVVDSAASADTDDVKGCHQLQQQQQQPLTDDIKADSSSSIHSDVYRSVYQCTIQLDETQLLTLATMCQSPRALCQLIDSSIISTLCTALRATARHSLCDTLDVDPFNSNLATDTVKQCGQYSAGGASATAAGTSHNISQQGQILTVDLIAPTLQFLAKIAKDTVMKDWLGQPDNCAFWPVLLHTLCNTGSACLLVRPSAHSILTSDQQMCIEAAAIEFFSNVISCHAKNQLTFAVVVSDVIQSQRNAVSGCGSLLSGFLRRLFLQVLLEDERVLVTVHSTQPMYKGLVSTCVDSHLQHPKFGVGHCRRNMLLSVHSTCADVLNKVAEVPSSSPVDDQQKVSDELRKDVSELGIEVIDQISAVAAGLKAKEKRDKDKEKSLLRPPTRRNTRTSNNNDQTSMTTTQQNNNNAIALSHHLLPDVSLPADITLSQLLQFLYEQGLVSVGDTCIPLILRNSSTVEQQQQQQQQQQDVSENFVTELSVDTPALSSALQVFSSVGGLALLAEHLPLLYPEFSRQTTPIDMMRDVVSGAGVGLSGTTGSLGHDWVTVESAEEIYEEIYEPPMPPSPPSQHKPAATPVLSIPPHSLVAFGLFLRLPGYAEVLLKEKRKATCLLRLIFGVTDDGEGGHILLSSFATELPTLPFFVLKSLFDVSPLTTDDGVVLRRMTLDIGVVHLILACLSVLGHHAPRQPIPGFHQEIIMAATQATATTTTTTTSSTVTQQRNSTEEKSQTYWAKGTGFGTGSTTSSWDAEQALLRQKSEEEHVTCFLQVLASYINPGGLIPTEFEATAAAVNVSSEDVDKDETELSSLPMLLPELLLQSCLVPALSSYLRNDSVLDMACHVPLYRSLLELLRAIAVCPSLIPLLLPLDSDDDSTGSVSSLLDKMKQCVDTYASRLKGGKMNGKSSLSSKQQQQRFVPSVDDDESEGLALLIPDIQDTARIVSNVVRRIQDKNRDTERETTRFDSLSTGLAGRLNHSEEERYIAVMKELQFDTAKMVQDDASGVRFIVAHHYESNVKSAGDVNNSARARRLAQEAVTLSTSLPLSAGSSVFVRCDEDRLDVMKVLMTGPSDTPYANGCFEFDVYFPVDYPNSPPLINLETTGNHTVRFNPNLYNDGKVCLSVLNTWHGRPEEKWNSQTSSFLQVLVSIQSLILVSEPYFNEPGYERSRGTPSGTSSSREYDANIRQATTKWAMLEMLRNPPSCFKQVVEWHFWLKKNEILSQVEEWIADLESYSSDKRVGRSIAHSCASLKRHYSSLKDELLKLKAPSDSVNIDTDSGHIVELSAVVTVTTVSPPAITMATSAVPPSITMATNTAPPAITVAATDAVDSPAVMTTVSTATSDASVVNLSNSSSADSAALSDIGGDPPIII